VALIVVKNERQMENRHQNNPLEGPQAETYAVAKNNPAASPKRSIFTRGTPGTL